MTSISSPCAVSTTGGSKAIVTPAALRRPWPDARRFPRCRARAAARGRTPRCVRTPRHRAASVRSRTAKAHRPRRGGRRGSIPRSRTRLIVATGASSARANAFSSSARRTPTTNGGARRSRRRLTAVLRVEREQRIGPRLDTTRAILLDSGTEDKRRVAQDSKLASLADSPDASSSAAAETPRRARRAWCGIRARLRRDSAQTRRVLSPARSFASRRADRRVDAGAREAEAAVDHEIVSGDEARLVREQEDDGVGHLFGRARCGRAASPRSRGRAGPARGRAPSDSGVRIMPGDTEFTRMRGPYSSAALCVSASTPAFAAA